MPDKELLWGGGGGDKAGPTGKVLAMVSAQMQLGHKPLLPWAKGRLTASPEKTRAELELGS